jgi:hypothetical protein
VSAGEGGGSMRAELPAADLEACRYHEQPTAEDPAEHAEQIREAARARRAARKPPSYFVASARTRRAARRETRRARGEGGSDDG